MNLPPGLAYGTVRYAAGSDGKSLLVGFCGQRPLFALAAGLASGRDRERFAILARYLLRRDGADAYWLMLPADQGGEERLVLEQAGRGQRTIQAAAVQRDEAGGFCGLNEAVRQAIEPPLGDLLDGGGTIAGIMRRELDRLAEALAVPLP
jgi:hypothetical protein